MELTNDKPFMLRVRLISKISYFEPFGIKTLKTIGITIIKFCLSM